MVITGLLLAAGGGRRMGGRPKALLADGGRLFVERAAGDLRAAGCARVVVILGAAAQEVRARADLSGYTVIDNPGWAAGMGSSLAAGLRAVPSGADAVLVALVDQPGIRADALARVAAACGGRDTLASAAYGGRRGHPVLLGAAHLPEVIRTARGDQGARAYLRQHESRITLVECGDIATPDDIDTPGELRRLQRSQ